MTAAPALDVSRDRLVTAGLLLALLACGGDPSGPPPDESPVASPLVVGDTVVRELTSADSMVLFTIRTDGPAEVALFMQAEAGASYTIIDSVTNELFDVNGFPPDPEPGHLLLTRSAPLRTKAGQVLLLRLFTPAARLPARLHLLVYPIDRAPEERAAQFPVGDTLRGETLANSADVDEFTFPASAGDELIAFVRGGEGIIPGGLRLDVFQPSGDIVASATTGPTDIELEGTSSEGFVAPVTGTYRIVVAQIATVGTPENPGTGPFTALIRRIDRAPEVVPATLVPGDTLVGERIEFVGDVDEFTVPVVGDSVYNVFLQTLPSDDQATLRATVIGAGEVPPALSAAGDTALAGQFTGDFTAPATGTLTVRVAGAFDMSALPRGSYRLFVYPVNRAPETAAGVLAPGDSAAEAIDYPGDVDRFLVSHPATDRVNVILRRPNTQSDYLDFHWPIAVGSQFIACYPREGETDSACATGLLITSSAMPVEVGSPRSEITRFRGPYRLVTLALDPAPEGRPAAIALGSTVTEKLDQPGDVDVYLLPYTAGTPIQLTGTGGSGTSTDGFAVSFEDPGGHFMPGYADMLPASTGRFTLPADGTYHFVVGGASSGQQLTETGPYSFTLSLFPTTAEVVTGPIAPGDSITAEPVQPVGDIDDFVLQGAAGAEVQVFVHDGGAFKLTVDAMVPGTNTVVRAGSNFATGRLTFPASGKIGLRVYEPRTFSGALSQSNLGYAGPYSLAVHLIDRAPETLPAALTLGVVNNGEKLDFEGDVDEFTFNGAAGQQVTGTFSAPFGLGGALATGELAIIDPGTDEVLGTAQSYDGTVNSTGSVVLPHAGTYRVRVQGVQDTAGKGGYRFEIQ
jgi:hypothetical protein